MISHFPTHRSFSSRSGLTLIELLIVIAIIAILMAIMIPGFGTMRKLAEAAKNVQNVKQIVQGTLTWGMDRGGKVPSPEYPGGMVVPNGMDEDAVFPKYWDLLDGGTQWLDGVVFASIYIEEAELRAEAQGEGGGGDEGSTGGYPVDENGTHLKGTIFESSQSVKKNPLETDWHRHSYAMNKNLQYDRLHETSGSSDPWLTEKTLSNLIFANQAMIYIDCIEQNIVSYDDRDMIIETIDERWDGGKAIVGFLDGHVERRRAEEIPDGDPDSDRQSSRFWRGVDIID